jgi:hypothetical protein
MATNSSIPKTAEWDKILLEKILPMGYTLVKSDTLYALTLHVFISTPILPKPINKNLVLSSKRISSPPHYV